MSVIRVLMIDEVIDVPLKRGGGASNCLKICIFIFKNICQGRGKSESGWQGEYSVKDWGAAKKKTEANYPPGKR